MLVLGLGCNLGDRLENLRKTLHAIKQLPVLKILQVSPLYVSDALLPENAPQDWNKPFINLAISCETSLQPLELLKQLKNIEIQIGRKPQARRWGTREIDIDILVWDDLILENEILNIPHIGLQDRPFALWPLADVAPLWVFPSSGKNQGKTAAQIVEAWGSRFSGEAPFHTKQINQRIDTPQLVGILNVTPDSFSDGGLFLQPEHAVKQMLHLLESGAEVIDIGAESTAPTAKRLTAEMEWQRLEPVLLAIKAQQNHCFISPKISVDTRHSEVAAKALDLGADWINDVSGLDDPAMREIISHSSADCVVMHHINIPENREHVLPRAQDPVKLVYEWAEKRLQELENQGIARQRIIFDPGIGFGKMAEQSLVILKNLSAFQALGTRILIGHSRKTFLALLCGLPFAERDIETMGMVLALAKQNIDYFRVHNVEMCARAIKAASAIV
jgi:2-amino-4-hydroxy-6-hydroxymethyldihydropteridine diphosphokinase/dihydropteroate synthase